MELSRITLHWPLLVEDMEFCDDTRTIAASGYDFGAGDGYGNGFEQNCRSGDGYGVGNGRSGGDGHGYGGLFTPD